MNQGDQGAEQAWRFLFHLELPFSQGSAMEQALGIEEVGGGSRVSCEAPCCEAPGSGAPAKQVNTTAAGKFLVEDLAFGCNSNSPSFRQRSLQD